MKLGRRSQSFALIRKFSSQHTQNKDYVKSFGIGLVSGILGALVGVGGSLVAIPLLTQFSGLPQHVAQGSAMVTAVFSSAGATIFNISNHISVSENEKVPNHVGNMHIPTVLSIAGPGSVAAVLGARLASKVSSRGLKISLGLFQIFVAPSAPLREYVLKYKQTLSKDVIEKNKSNEFLVSLVIGGFSGLIAGFFGVGGGAVTVPALCLFTDLDYKTALGTSLGGSFLFQSFLLRCDVLD